MIQPSAQRRRPGLDHAAAGHWSQQGERGSQGALRLMAWIAITLGRRIARAFLHPIALYFVVFAPTARRRSQRYLARATGRPADWRAAYRHIHAFATTILDRVYFASGRTQGIEVQISGAAEVVAQTLPGKGALLLGAHLGSFEALHSLGSSNPGVRVAMAMYPDNARKIHAVLQSVAPNLHLDIIEVGRPGAALRIRDWLDAGGLVGMLGDRFLDAAGARNNVSELSFLGHPARFTDGPLRLAMLLRRRVFLMVGLYLGGSGYQVRFTQLADFTTPSGAVAQREQAIAAALAGYVAWLEALCREAPYNWFNFHDFWDEDATH